MPPTLVSTAPRLRTPGPVCTSDWQVTDDGLSAEINDETQEPVKTVTTDGWQRFMNGRAQPGSAYVPTKVEHVANMVTHGLWIVPSIGAMLWMIHLSSCPLQTCVSIVYGFSLPLLFSVSTVFHTISYSGHCGVLKNFFHIGDRAAIYFFIAASYTPWLVLKDFGGWGMLTLYVVWTASLLGVLYQYTFHEQYKWLETAIYLVIGVCPSIVCLAMREPTSGLPQMAAGGGVYILGVVFFKSDGIIPFAHAIWHCFVSVGATFHFLAVCIYLLGQHNELGFDELSR